MLENNETADINVYQVREAELGMRTDPFMIPSDQMVAELMVYNFKVDGLSL